MPWHAKLIAGAAAVYVASPVDLLPDVIPGVGGLDDLLAVLVAVRRLVTAAGYDLVREHWTGTDDGFGVLIVLAGVGSSRPSETGVGAGADTDPLPDGPPEDAG